MLGGSEDSPGWGSSRLSLGVLPGGHYKVHVPGHCSQGEAQVHFSEVPSESGAHLVESSLTSGEATEAQGEGGRPPGTESQPWDQHS